MIAIATVVAGRKSRLGLLAWDVLEGRVFQNALSPAAHHFSNEAEKPSRAAAGLES
jgi:hypothetical protein